MKLARAASGALVILVLSGSASAAEGRIPIYEPTTITESGRYVVTRAIAVESLAQQVISVMGTGVERVDIDLNGFELVHAAGGVVISAIDLEALVIRNGFLRTSGAGGNSAVVVGGVNGSSAGKAVLEALSISGGERGLELFDAPGFVVRDNVIVDTAGSGIEVFGVDDEVVAGRVEDNLIRNAGAGGILVGVNTTTRPRAVVIQGNHVENVMGTGIALAGGSGFVLRANVIVDAGFGIQVFGSTSGLVEDNVVHGSGGLGMRLGAAEPVSDCSIRGNVIANSGGVGLTVGGDRNQVVGNTVTGNLGGGIRFTGDDNMYGGNSARGNSGSPVCKTPPPGAGCAAPDFCDNGTGNTSFGDNLVPGPPTC